VVASHLVIGDEMEIFITDLSPFYDEIDVVMEMNSICDDRFWSSMILSVRNMVPTLTSR
jgi:hypothetical protein